MTIVGDAADNTIVVSSDAGGVIQVNGGGIQVLGEIPTVANTSRVRISGLAGNDTLSLDEADGALPPAEISGGAGNDTLIGGSGADILTGGTGDDQVFGNAGNDRLIWNNGDGSDLNEGGAGVDTIEINGGDVDEAFLATVVNDSILFQRVDPAPFSIVIGTSENLIIKLNGGDDSFAADGNLPGLFVDGGAGNDTIFGGAGNDRLVGGDGNDFIDGNQGDDAVFLDAGDDTFRWDLGDASDVVQGGAGSDRMLFNGSNTSEGIDVTANGERVLFFRNLGSINMDLNEVERVDFNALGGADTITVGDLSGTDLVELNINLKAGEGGGDLLTDSVIVNATGREDNVEVTGTGSFYSILGLPAAINVGNSEGTLDNLVVKLGDGNDTFSAETLAAGVAILTVDGGTGDDFVLGSQGPDTFIWNPGDGSDRVEGQGGNDKLIFNGADVAENFEISANGNRVRFVRDLGNILMDLNGIEVIDLNAFAGADNITVNDLSASSLTALNLNLDSASGTGFGDNARDSVIINGTNGDDAIQIASFETRIAIGGLFPFVNIRGEDGLDTLTLNTLGGNDAVDAANLFATNASQLIRLTVAGGAGNDTIAGSQGFDTFVWNPGDGNDTIEGGNGEDTMIFNGSDVAERFDLSSSGNRVRLTRDIDGVMVDFGSVETLALNPLGGADTITVNDLTGSAVTRINVNLSGTDGDNVGDGHGDSVVVNGTSEADLIPVQGIVAGILVNGDFASQHGLPYFMFIPNVEPTDALRINGGGGDDTIDAATLETLVIFTADGGAGNDVLKGGSHDDLLLGGDCDDFIDANAGADVALLGAGQDTFQWDPGDGSDVVEGQDGSDKMIFNGSDDSESIDITANSDRVRLLRNVGNVVVDLNGVEEIDFNAFGGNDSLMVTDRQPSSLLLALSYNAGAGDNALVLQEGSARIDSTAVGGTLNTVVAVGAHLSTSRLNQNGLTIAENGRVTLLPNAEASVVTDLQLGTGATLDIGTGSLIVDYSGPSPAATIREKILSGRTGPGLGKGLWTGTGITSGAAAAANKIDSEMRSVGYAENALLPLGAFGSFRGVAVDDTAVLITFTRNGDANLDGVVNDDDVTVVGAAYAPGVANANWAAGDFDYSGFVDDDDVTIVGAFFNPSAEPVAPPLTLASPKQSNEVELRSVNGSSNDLIALVGESIASDSENSDGLAKFDRRADRRSIAVDKFWANWV